MCDLRKFFLPAVVSALLSLEAFGVTGKDAECIVTFPFDSVNFDKANLVSCIKTKNTKKQQIRFIHIFATASSPGTLAYNRKLSDRRADSIAATLKEALPNTKLKVHGGGEHPYGQTAKVYVLYGDGPVQVRYVKEPPKPKNYRALATAGRDYYWGSEDFYNRTGIELSRRFLHDGERFYSELGLGLSYLAEDEIRDLQSQKVFYTVGYKRGSVFTGIQAFVGNVTRSDFVQNRFNGGGIYLLGLERGSFSTQLAVGRSERFTHLGVGLGTRF